MHYVHIYIPTAREYLYKAVSKCGVQAHMFRVQIYIGHHNLYGFPCGIDDNSLADYSSLFYCRVNNPSGGRFQYRTCDERLNACIFLYRS